MIQNYLFPGEIKIGQHKPVSGNVQLEVATYKPDAFSPRKPEYPEDQYTDGLRVMGELSFDSKPLQPADKHPIKTNAVGELIVRFEGDSTRFNVLVTEKTGESVVVPNRVRRYFWQFVMFGKCKFDGLELFPKPEPVI